MYCTLCGEIPGPGLLMARELRDAPAAELKRLVIRPLAGTVPTPVRGPGKKR